MQCHTRGLQKTETIARLDASIAPMASSQSPKNCEAALRRLRLPSAPRQLWVDAICIDQTNIEERNHQVGMMDLIFRLASTVHVCIQDPNHRYTDCIHWLRRKQGWRDGTAIPSSRPHGAVIIAQWEELFRKRYFSRVWVSKFSAVRQKHAIFITV
jgi:hypothetical protein